MTTEKDIQGRDACPAGPNGQGRACDTGSGHAAPASGGERIVPMRLQKFLARAGVASRRGSENLMTAGRVCVNGRVVTELGSKVDPLVDTVTVDGAEVRLGDGPVTLMLHKPAGVITTMHDQVGRPCVADLVPTDDYPGLFPIGRLDSDTTGLLLFSTDGELGNGLLHPRHHVSKTYLVCAEGRIDRDAIEQLRSGVVLDDGPTQPAAAEVLDAEEAAALKCLLVMPSERAATPKERRERLARERKEMSFVRIEIREGRYHQVKRMFDAIGFPVLALHRTSFGPLDLNGLERGRWRVLSADEVSSLHDAVMGSQ